MTAKLNTTITCFVFMIYASSAQVNMGSFFQFVSADSSMQSANLQYPKEVKQFYTKYVSNVVWINNVESQKALMDMINKSSELGLEKKDYLFTPSYNTLKDSIITELRFADAAIHFCRDVAYGNKAPAFEYNGLKYTPDCINSIDIMVKMLQTNRLYMLITELEPKSKEYIALKEKINQYNKIMSDVAFKEVLVTSDQVNSTNTSLCTKLYQLGFLDSASQKITTAQLIHKLKIAQRFLSLTEDGLLNKNTLEPLNVSLAFRVRELALSLNTMRWLNCIKQNQSAIIINIPSANLVMYRDRKNILESRIVVGKKTTPTPTQCSRITEVILHPYWTVPYSIATKEILPIVKKDIAYLSNHNLEVLDEYEQVVDPTTIEWDKLSKKNFPYTLRQATGFDNSLGIVKFNFYNPFNTYLHDTPQKGLFKRNKRYFSHGCMRVEKAVALAKVLLKNNTKALAALEMLEKKGNENASQDPVFSPISQKVLVFVLYNTAWSDTNGNVLFYEDVYEKNL